jgi:hypothetical protein
MRTSTRHHYTAHYGPQHIEYAVTGDICQGTDGFDLFVDGIPAGTGLTWREMVAAIKAL